MSAANLESRDVYATLDLALRVGEVVLSSGAGAADVSATMVTVANACGLRGATAAVTFTELEMSYQASLDNPTIIQVRHVQYRVIDYDHLTQVDHLVHDLLDGAVGREEARHRLNRIVSSGHRLPRWAVSIGWGAVGGGVGLLVGGNWVVVAIAATAAMGVDVIQRWMARRRLPGFYQQVAGGLFATLLAVATAAIGVPVSPSQVVTASIITLLSGISFMGAIQDALTGFPLTAGGRILEALLSTSGLIAGVSGGLTVGRLLGVDLGRLNPGAMSLADISWATFGAAVAAAAFAFACFAPLRALLPTALVAALSQVVFRVALDSGVGVAWASATAAVLVGVVSYTAAGRVRVPPLAVVVPAVVPLLPGLSIYRGLSLLSNGGDGTLSIVSAGAIAIALAAGVIFGEYLAQPLKREARRLENRLSGPRLVGPRRTWPENRATKRRPRRGPQVTPAAPRRRGGAGGAATPPGGAAGNRGRAPGSRRRER